MRGTQTSCQNDQILCHPLAFHGAACDPLQLCECACGHDAWGPLLHHRPLLHDGVHLCVMRACPWVCAAAACDLSSGISQVVVLRILTPPKVHPNSNSSWHAPVIRVSAPGPTPGAYEKMHCTATWGSCPTSCSCSCTGLESIACCPAANQRPPRKSVTLNSEDVYNSKVCFRTNNKACCALWSETSMRLR